jgi:tetratricopeptide (TPR) repeat protein
MLRVLGRGLRIPGRAWSAVRRRPRLALVSILVLLAGSGVGLWRYAVHQWRAAGADLKEERLADARGRLDFCLTVWPRSPDVHLLAARAARLSGDLDTAEAHLNRCLRLQDGASEAVQLEFLLLRVQTGELEEVAPALIDTVENGHPDAPAILHTLARAYMHRLRYQMAWSCLTRCIEIKPDDAKAYHWRGWVLERLNNHKAATEDYHRALELDPDLVPVRLRVAEMLIEDKQAPEALPHLERLYQQVPDNPQVRARLGMCRLLQGRMEEARRLMEAAVVHMPHDPALLVSLANLELQEGRGVEAERWLRAVLQEEPSDTEALYVLASALQLQGRTEESAAVLSEHERKKQLVERVNTLLTTVADSPTAGADDYAETGRLLLEIGRDKNGLYWLDRALERDPGNQQAHRALAAYHGRKGDAARAAFHRRSVREPAPETTGSRPNP